MEVLAALLLLLLLGFAVVQEAAAAAAAAASAPPAPGLPPPPPAATQQRLQAALFSIDERLRALDSYYSIRFGGRWDVEGRLESIEARIGRLETLLEIRTEKLLEAVTSYQMKDTMTKEQVNRKMDTLHDRLSHRMAYMENRMDANVAKIQSSMESGFLRVGGRPEANLENQLQELQRRLDEFGRGHNLTLEALLRGPGAGATRIPRGDPDGGDGPRQGETTDDRLERLVDRVDRMVGDVGGRGDALEALVRASMSLTNATRREVQEGFKTLGHRKMVQQQGNSKHNANKEKEATAASLEGWDALSNLLSKEFGSLAKRIDANHDELAKDHHLFIEGCHRVQENESQLEAEIASVLERILDRVHNRSHDVEKRVATLHEMVKSHDGNVMRALGQGAVQAAHHSRQLEAAVLRAVEGERGGVGKIAEGMADVLADIKVLQNQVSGSLLGGATSQNSTDRCPANHPNETAIANHILSTILQQNTTVCVNDINVDPVSQVIADKISNKLECKDVVDNDETSPKSSKEDKSPLTEDYVQMIINRTIESYNTNTKAHLLGNQMDSNGMNKALDGSSKSTQTMPDDSFDCQPRPNESGTKSDASEVGSRKGSILDIPAHEAIVGETIEYNVTKGEDPDDPKRHSRDSPTDQTPHGGPKNSGDATKRADLEMPAANDASEGPGHDRETWRGGRDDGTSEEEENGEDVAATADYDFDRTSSEVDKSEPAYYDESSDGGVDGERVIKFSNGSDGEMSHGMSADGDGLHDPTVEHRSRSPLPGDGQRRGEGASSTGTNIASNALEDTERATGVNVSLPNTSRTRNATHSATNNASQPEETETDDGYGSLHRRRENDVHITNKPSSISTILHRIIAGGGDEPKANDNTRTDLSEPVLKGRSPEVNVTSERAHVAEDPGSWDVINTVDSEQETSEDTQDELYEFGYNVPPSR